MDFAMVEENGKSIVVANATFQADARGLETGIFALFFIILLWVVSGLFSLGVAALVESSGPLGELRDAVERRAAFIPRFKRRRDFLVKMVTERNEYANTMQTHRATLKKKLNKLRTAQDLMVRQVGESTVGAVCHTFVVVNRYVVSYAARGVQHPLLDDSWKSGQLVEAWSRSPGDAFAAVVDRYPTNLGFQVQKLEETGKDGGGDNAANAMPEVIAASA